MVAEPLALSAQRRQAPAVTVPTCGACPARLLERHNGHLWCPRRTHTVLPSQVCLLTPQERAQFLREMREHFGC